MPQMAPLYWELLNMLVVVILSSLMCKMYSAASKQSNEYPSSGASYQLSPNQVLNWSW